MRMVGNSTFVGTEGWEDYSTFLVCVNFENHVDKKELSFQSST